MSTTPEKRINNTFKAELKSLWHEYNGGKNPTGEAYLRTARIFKMPVQEIKKAIVKDEAVTRGVSEEVIVAEIESKRVQKQEKWTRYRADMRERDEAARAMLEAHRAGKAEQERLNALRDGFIS